jgi:oxygen-dependent protoporphyrinogen oxidase
MGDLADALGRRLRSAVRFNCRVTGLDRTDSEPGGGLATSPPRFLVRLADAPPLLADSVVLAAAARESAAVCRPLDAPLATALAGIDTAPVAVLCLGYDEAAVTASRGPLNGFGFLVAPGTRLRVRGVTWESSIYRGRAPAGRVLLRIIMGGAQDPEAVFLDDDALLRIVRGDLGVAMNLHLRPDFVHVIRHPAGIPQYRLGHTTLLDRIDERLGMHPGLYVCGHSYRGVSLNACIADATRLAERILPRTAPQRSSEPPNARACSGPTGAFDDLERM